MNRRDFLAGGLSSIPAGFIQRDAAGATSIDTDRWLEIDLYWFDKDNLEKSVSGFWDRYAALFRGVSGWRGVILNVGWVMDYVLDWRGNLDGKIPFPQHMAQEHWFRVGGLLTGDTAERKRQWKQRFANPATSLRAYYQDWTYRDLKLLAHLLRERARTKYGLSGIKVGSFVLGFRTIYGGEASPWTRNHKEAYFAERVFGQPVFNPQARLAADPTAFGAFPNGIRAGAPVNLFFGAQWGHLSKAVGLDAIVLRDSLLGPIAYRRRGPWGASLPPDPQAWAALSEATGALVKATKEANPDALVIGYSTGASAVGEWRVEGVDLEAIARQGYLDGYIDQTWAGAWNEVGVRESSFWNNPYLGWTYQLAYVLLHGAMFAGTRVRHYTLVETFDAWESWDIIHTAPERLKWGMWAYLHAAVKTPDGLKMPAGSYISWGNQGKRLLSEEDVSFLAASLNEAVHDARQTRAVFGPTLVYSREAMEWQSGNAPGQSIKEWIDEQAAAVMKWSVPILSVTRTEYLPHIQTDLPILQSPVHLKAAELEHITRMISSGRPIAIFGTPAGGIDPALARLAGIETSAAAVGAERRMARLATEDPQLSEGIPPQFAIFQPFTLNRATEGAEVIVTVDQSPVLIRNRNVVFWDPADFDLSSRGASIRERMGSQYVYVLVARILSRMLAGSGTPYVRNIEAELPVCLHVWQLRNGQYRILLGNTEEGISDGADQSRHVVLRIAAQGAAANRPPVIRDLWRSTPPRSGTDVKIDLPQAGCALLSATRR
jgi:hypothetical protein